MKNLFTMLCFLALSTGLMAQGTNVVGASNSFTAYLSSGGSEKKVLEEGYGFIKKAEVNESTKDDPKTWWYSAYISLLIDQDTVLVKKYPDAIFEAANALVKSIDLATVPEAKKFRFLEDAQEAMGKVTVILYNRAVEAGIAKNDAGAYTAFKRSYELSNYMKSKGFAAKNKLTLVTESKYYYAQYALALGKTDEAKKLFNELIAEGFNNADLYVKVASLHKAEGNEAEAVATLQKGMKAFPNDLGLAIEMINIYLGSGRETEAIDVMLKAIALDPTNHQLYFVTGVAYGKIKNYDKAIEFYNKALELNPKYADAYNNIGAVYLDQSNEYATKRDATDLKDPKSNEYEKQRIEYLKKAIPALEKANELKPGNLEIMDVLRTLYAKVGDYDKAGAMKKQIDALKK
ncbi:tetratricopeptide repeat protein [soil metagenome]